MKSIGVALALVIGIAVAAIAIVVGTGIYNVAADEEHTALGYWLLQTTRDRSIAARAADIEIPDLADHERVRRGAGNYDSMCAGCHLAPDAQETELSRGLYPEPPNLSRASDFDPARAFWVIKHGIKSTGMPAWGKSMEDQYIWDMVAFLREMPSMNAEQYAAAVRASEGHSHGGGESTDEHGDDAHEPSSSEGHSHENSTGESEPAAHGHSHDNAHTHAEPNSSAGGSLSGDVLRTVRGLHAALSAGDAAEIERALDPNVLIMEGGNVERSREEYAAHHLKSDVEFMRSMKYTLERQTGESLGDLAWVATEATLTGESRGKTLNLASTESLVLKRTRAGWRIVHIHWSSRGESKG